MVEAMMKMFRAVPQDRTAAERPAPPKTGERSPIKKTIMLPNGSSFTRLNKNVLDFSSNKPARNVG